MYNQIVTIKRSLDTTKEKGFTAKDDLESHAA